MEAKLYLEGPIGYADYEGGVTFSDVYRFFQDNADADSYEITIVSPGGYVNEGFQIARYIEQVAATKPVKTVAVSCASIATVIFLSGSERYILRDAEFMIHNPWTVAGGDANELERIAEDLRAEESRILDYYVERTGASRERLADLMAEESYLKTTEVLELGFAQSELSLVLAHKAPQTFKAVALIQRPKITNEYMNTQKEGSVNEVQERVEKSVMAKVKEFLNPVKALEIALANGSTLKVKTKENAPTIGDSVQALVDGKSQSIENGEYENSEGTQIFVIEGGKIADILTKQVDPDGEPILALADIEGYIAGAMNEAGKLFAAKLEEITGKLDEAQATNAKVKAEFEAVRDELQQTKQELLELKAGTSSTYTAPRADKVKTTPETKEIDVQNLDGLELQTLKGNRSKIRKMNKKDNRQKIGVE